MNKNVLEHIEDTVRDIMPLDARILLFGSRARGDARPDSDWDILIILNKNNLNSATLLQIMQQRLCWCVSEWLWITPTTYGRDSAYCLKSRGGVRGIYASLWRFLLRCALFCRSDATFLTSVSSYEGGCGFEVYELIACKITKKVRYLTINK